MKVSARADLLVCGTDEANSVAVSHRKSIVRDEAMLRGFHHDAQKQPSRTSSRCVLQHISKYLGIQCTPTACSARSIFSVPRYVLQSLCKRTQDEAVRQHVALRNDPSKRSGDRSEIGSVYEMCRCVGIHRVPLARQEALSRGLTAQKLDDEVSCDRPCVKTINFVWRIVWKDYPELPM